MEQCFDEGNDEENSRIIFVRGWHFECRGIGAPGKFEIGQTVSRFRVSCDICKRKRKGGDEQHSALHTDIHFSYRSCGQAALSIL